MTEVILFSFIILAGTCGELCVSRAMKAVGEVNDFRPRAIVKVILRALSVGWMWAGVGLMALAFFSLLGALSLLNVRFRCAGHCFELCSWGVRRDVLPGRACQPTALGWAFAWFPSGSRWCSWGIDEHFGSQLPFPIAPRKASRSARS